MTVNIDNLAQAHKTLIVEYIQVLNQVSKLPTWILVELFMKDHYLPGFNSFNRYLLLISRPLFNISHSLIRWPTLRYLVRLFVESHIKGKLNELSVSYIYLLQTVSEDDTGVENIRSWLKESSETCEKLASTLISVQSAQGLLSTLWPIAASLLAAFLGVNSLREALATDKLIALAQWIILIPTPMIYLGIFVTSAFWYKRQLFTGFSFFDTLILPSQSQDSTRNIYQLEDEIFKLLDRGKVREFPYDMVSLPITFFSMSFLFLSDWLFGTTRMPDRSDLVFGLMMILGGIFMGFLTRSRKWK
jgi:hypothetical protein